MEITHKLAVGAGKMMKDVHAGDEKLAIRKIGQRVGRIEVHSTSFDDGARMDRRFAGDGADVSPELHWTGTPGQTRSIAILCEDPDAPMPKAFAHWVLFDIPPEEARLPETAAGMPLMQGQNSMRKTGYSGPMPPPGHGVHHYHFQVFALDCVLRLGDGVTRDALVDAMRGHVLAAGEVVGTYERA